ncbi:hypothetical protein CHELA1G11_10806 [Hyphomicrobiales bacterium]|nr:hypothetical protein CHELA1G11_10806 [Hyphomicrobiales bacterium]
MNEADAHSESQNNRWLGLTHGGLFLRSSTAGRSHRGRRHRPSDTDYIPANEWLPSVLPLFGDANHPDAPGERLVD